MSYIICFWDKSKIQVSDLVGEKLKEAVRTQSIKTFEIGASLYSVGGIEKIITKEEAWEAFPMDWERLKDMEDRTPNAGSLPSLASPKLPTNNPQGLKRLNEIKYGPKELYD